MENKEEKTELAAKRYSRLWHALRPAVRLYLKVFHGFTGETAPKIDGPVLIMSNHTSGYDELFIGASWPEPVRFVGGEHLWRMGKALRFILDRYQPVIARVKGSTDAASAAGMLRALRGGGRVCIYPEGNMTFNGVTGDFHPTSARIIKAARGATLVTYRVTGGYYSTPRWAKNRRRGKQRGVVQGVYSPEELKAMSVDDVQAILDRDLYVDAYEQHKEDKVSFSGKALAECLETALYICPMCGKEGHLKSESDRFFCSCGFEVTVDEYSFFHGDTTLPFTGVLQWDQWQEARVKAMAEDGTARFTDPGQTLWEQLSDHSSQKVTEGDIELSAEGLKLGDQSFPIREIGGVDLVLKDRLFFSAGGRHFYVTSDHLRCGRKYVTLFKYLKASV